MTIKKFIVGAMLLVLAGPSLAATTTLALDFDTGWYWPTKQRWKDMAGNLYEGQWDATAYDNANVVVNYNVVGQQLVGTVTGTGLKPNFAYQLKLEGLGSGWTNTTLGNLGRWSGSTGYLLFDFMTTDENGDVTTTFTTDSSYHVLMRTSDSTGTTGTYGFGMSGAKDGPISYSSFDPDIASSWYDVDYGAATVGVYAQYEPGRALPGTLDLPLGDYVCKFVLTEESFHDGGWAGAPGGYWPTPFKGDISFAVPVPAPGALLLGTMGVGLVGWLRRRKTL